MPNEFAIADLHLGHQGMLAKGRPFASLDEMHETIIERWNAVVRPQDNVRVLGDIAWKEKYLPLLSRLAGHLTMVGGNHDQFKAKLYAQYFKKIYGIKEIGSDLVLSHVPIHPISLKERWLANVHGHHHARTVDLGPRYFNVSVEMIDYTPIALETIRDQIRKQNKSE